MSVSTIIIICCLALLVLLLIQSMSVNKATGRLNKQLKTHSAAEKQLITLIDTIPQLVWISRPDGSVEYYNKSWYEYTGLSPEASLGRGGSQVVHPDDLMRARERWSEALATGTNPHIEYRLRSAEGDYRWFLGQALPFKDDTGNIVSWYGTITDIDEQVNTRTNMRANAVELEKQVAQRTSYLQLLQRLAFLANESTDYASTVEAFLKEIGSAFQFEIGHFFEQDKNPDYLVSSHLWYVQGCQNSESFKAATESLRFSAHQGLIGGVIASAAPIWLEDLPNSPTYLRTDAARAAGLLTGVAFPVLMNKSVVGVLEFYSTQLRRSDPALLHVFEQIGEHLGRVIERQKHLLAITAKEHLLKYFVANTPASVAIFDKRMNYIYVSKRWVQDYECGYDSDSIIGKSHYEIFPDLPDQWKAIHARCLAGNIERNQADPWRRDDKEIIWINWEVHPWYENDGSIGGIFIFSENITEQHEAAAKIELAEQRYRGLFEGAYDAIVVVNKEGNIQLANARTFSLFGYSSNELLGQPVEILLPETRRLSHAQLRSNYFHQPQSRAMGAGIELNGVKKDGSTVALDISLSPVITSDELQVTAIIRDITERRQAEATLKKQADELSRRTQELARSNYELEQFAYVASHDLKEPLRMITSYTQLIARRYETQLDEQAKQYIHFVVDGALQLNALISDLLTYSRASQGELPLATVDFSLLIVQVLKNLSTTIEESGASITFDPLPTTKANSTQMSRVLQNLLSNAIKFHGKSTPRIHVSCRVHGTEWLFSIQDNGIGIDPQFASRIFVLFQRLHPRRVYPGTGIGLAVCKKIIERHGGRIWFESQPDKGTCFYFTLPKMELEERQGDARELQAH